MTSSFIWSTSDGQGRCQHVYFRRDFNLREVPEPTLIHLFADSHYQLWVNGTFVNAGPARFYPEYPLSDTHNITALLQTGPNVVAVHAYNPGIATFHTILHEAGFIAWGECGQISFDTPGEWRCHEAPGYDRTTAKYSFAQAPFDLLDSRLGVPNWNQIGLDTSTWSTPVLLKEQHAWGELKPRDLPLLQHKEMPAARLLWAHQNEDAEEWFSFHLPNLWRPQLHFLPNSPAYAHTYIFSPRDQTLAVTLFWGEHYLNGTLLIKSPDERGFGRERAELPLRVGWNSLYVEVRMFGEAWDFHMLVPRAARLELSPNRRHDDVSWFVTSGPYEEPFADEATLRETAERERPHLPLSWVEQPQLKAPALPIRHLAWLSFGETLAFPETQVQDFRLDQNATLVFDMGREVLGRIFVEWEAAAGTVLDVGHTEDLLDGRPWILKNIQVNAGDRHISAGGVARFETFHPRGFRYLQITLSNLQSPVHVYRVGIREQTYPHPRLGEFSCSSERLTAIWQAGERTLRVCSEDVYTDCPWRERTLYAGDLLSEAATALVVSGDTALAKRSLQLLIQSQNPETGWQQSQAPMDRDNLALFDYPLLTLLCFEWLTRLTHDRDFEHEAFPQWKALMERALLSRRPDGLFVASPPPFIDHHTTWPEICTPLNALFARALEAFARLCARRGHAADAGHYADLALQTAASVRDRMFDEAARSFSDGMEEGCLSGSHLGIASAWCSFFGVTSPEQEAALRVFFRGRFEQGSGAVNTPPPLASAYGAFFLLGGLYDHGNEELAEQFMERTFGPMLDAGSDCLWEFLGPHQSLAHAWSSAPTHYLSSRALGVRLDLFAPTEPNCILIEPQAHSLTWAEGAVPHPLGLVRVRWRVEDEALKLQYEAPPGIEVKVRPQGRLGLLRLDIEPYS